MVKVLSSKRATTAGNEIVVSSFRSSSGHSEITLWLLFERTLHTSSIIIFPAKRDHSVRLIFGVEKANIRVVPLWSAPLVFQELSSWRR